MNRIRLVLLSSLVGAALLSAPSFVPVSAADSGGGASWYTDRSHQASARPTVVVFSPQSGQIVTGDRLDVILRVEAAYSVKRLEVELYADDDFPDEWWTFDANADDGEDSLPCIAGDCRFTLDLGSFADGPGALHFTVEDRNGVSSLVTKVPVIFNRELSQAALYEPSAGAELSGRVALLAKPLGNATSVRFYIDGIMLDGVPRWEDSDLMVQYWDTRQWSNGSHTVAVGGFDGNADPPGPPISVRVKNPVPVYMEVSTSRGQTTRDVRTVTVAVEDSDGREVSGLDVTLVAQWPGGNSLIGSAKTNSTGKALFDVRLAPPVRFIATFSGDADYARAEASVTVRQRTSVRFDIGVSQAPVGVRYTNSVAVFPPTRVRFQRQYLDSSGRWALSDTYRTNKNGLWKEWFSGKRVGQGTFRVVVPQSEWLEEGISNTDSIRWVRNR